MTEPTSDSWKPSIDKLFALFGGKDEFLAASDARLDEFNSIWRKQNAAEDIGRVLKAHLGVEHFLTLYLKATNPNLGSIEGLGFYRKVEMIGGEKDLIAISLKPALKKLNEIRNKIAHRLRVDLTVADCEPIITQPFFAAMYRAKDPSAPPLEAQTPLWLIEAFAMFAASMLYCASDPNTVLWEQAFRDSEDGMLEQKNEQ